METTNIVDFARRDGMTDALTELLKSGAQELIAVNRPQFAGGSRVSMDGAYGKTVTELPDFRLKCVPARFG